MGGETIAPPPRVLVGTVVNSRRLHALPRWAEGLRRQSTGLRWDVLLSTPAPLVTPELHRWVRGEPFGSYHRIRLRSPADDDEAAGLPLGKFGEWLSYSLLLSLELDVWMSDHCLQRLHEADVPWAAASPRDARAPIAPLACALLGREAVVGGAAVRPTYVAGAWWERIPWSPSGQPAHTVRQEA